MLDLPNNALMPDFILEVERAKNCRKASYRKKIKNVPEACVLQNEIRKEFSQILPKEMLPIEDTEYGIDYIYKGITLDQKFCFGALGDRTIKIRVRNRNLLNKSDWTMIINKDKRIEFFETKKLAIFVKKNWGMVQKRLVQKKEYYSEYAVKLAELYWTEKVTPYETSINEEELFTAMEFIACINSNQTQGEFIFDSSKKICIEPSIMALIQSAINL